jgi:hypothetical protein
VVFDDEESAVGEFHPRHAEKVGRAAFDDDGLALIDQPSNKMRHPSTLLKAIYAENTIKFTGCAYIFER